MAYVYLLHFAEPLEHNQHYVGSCRELDPRMAQHRAGRGAVLTTRFHRAGIGFTVACVWEYETFTDATRAERKMKKNGAGRRRCTVCRALSAEAEGTEDVAASA